MVLGLGSALAEDPVAPIYVGSAKCSQCHVDQARAWRDSHHALAWTLPTDQTVLGDFDDTEFQHDGTTTRFFRNGTAFQVEADGPAGQLETYIVSGVAGVEPLQQYLVETGPGRQQALDIAWDIERHRWYHLYPDSGLKAGDGLHWTGPYKNWNARCGVCHATGYEKRFDPEARRYDSREAEIGVGCEACHGPGSAHVDWADGKSVDASGHTEIGLVLAFLESDPEAEIQQCAGCHARREPLGGDSPLPGTLFHDSYSLALLRPDLYHADGAIKDEVYVYGSFLQSKMYQKGVRCTDCHNPHDARSVADANAVCTQCHSPLGNSRFPSLRAAMYDDPMHHFHPLGSDGAACTSCHMIERTYMGVDKRRDHSFRIPRPDLSDETGAPNACVDCHAGRDNAWAAAEIAARFPNSPRRGPHFSQTYAAFRVNPEAASLALMETAESTEAANIVRATSLSMLRGVATPEIARRAAALLDHPDPLIRSAAVGVQRGAQPIDRVQRLIPLLADPVRTVRIAAAREFTGAPIAHLPPATERMLRSASAEWRATLLAKTDYPETHLVIGGVALTLRNLRAAEAAFREAVQLDPQLTDAWAMIVRIRDAVGDANGARDALSTALDANPTSLMLLQLDQSLDD